MIFALGIAACFLISLLLLDQRQRNERALAAQALDRQHSLLEAVIRLHQHSIDTLFDRSIAGNRHIPVLLARAQNPIERDRVRDPLQAWMLPAFEQLQLIGVDILTFRLPDHQTLLRVHRPQLYGDYSGQSRILIQQAAASGLPQHGFELGRLVPAYRSILPVLDSNGDVLATVDIGIPMHRLIDELRSVLSERALYLILPESPEIRAIIEAGEWPYARWPGSASFFVDLASNMPAAADADRDDSSEILELWHDDPQIQQLLESLQPATLSFRHAGEFRLLSQTPIVDSRGDALALLVSHEAAPGLELIRNQFWIYLAIALLALVAVVVILLKLTRASTEKLGERERLLTITRSLGEGLLVSDHQGLITEANPRACQLLGLELEQLIGQAAWTVFGLSRDENPDAAAALCGQVEYRGELAYRSEGGPRRFLRFLTVPLVGQHARQGAVTLLEDISQLKRSLERLKLAGTVFTQAHEGILVTDADGRILDVNAAFSRITGYSRREAVGKTPGLLRSGIQDEAFYAEMWLALQQQGSWQGEIWNRRKDGSVYPETLKISAVASKEGQTSHYVAMFSDVSDQKTQERQIRRLALYDPLTELPNRVLLTTRLTDGMLLATENRRPLAVAMIDLDGFKQLNDQYGREVGDQLLVTLAGRMRSSLRSSDTIGRLGGDEFAIILTDLARADSAGELLKELLRLIAKPVQVEQHQLELSASIGYTLFPQRGDIDAEQLLRQADQAMYRAKLAGKNRVHEFNLAEDSAVRGRIEQLDQVRLALEENQFCLHYQPKVDLVGGQVFGVEALVRWQHPEEGLIPPGKFLPLIAGDRLEVDLDLWVLGAALAQADTWHQAGLALEVSINVCGACLQQPDFDKILAEQLARYPQLPPEYIQLEIVESSALADVETVSEIMAKCTQLGVSFALDDFGTGYSSLTYLRRLPAKTLKIDQSFVRDMQHDPDDLAILDGILNLARAFDRKAIAEGVETLEDGVLLIQFGCRQAQGYVIAKPLPPDQLVNWIGHWQPNPSWTNAAPIDRLGQEILYGIAEHRGWMAMLMDHLTDALPRMRDIESFKCRLGHRLSGSLRSMLSSSVHAEIERSHQVLHDLASDLVERFADGDRQAVADGRSILEHQSAQLLLLLQRVIDRKT